MTELATLPGLSITLPAAPGVMVTSAHGTEWKTILKFWVDGIPRPGGSKKAMTYNRRDGSIVMKNGRPLVGIVEDGKHTKEWRQDVKAAAREAVAVSLSGSTWPLSCPVAVGFRFVMPRIGEHFKVTKSGRHLRVDAARWHTKKPDTTKLVRAAEDSLTGIIFADDALVAKQWAEKHYGDRPGMEVIVYIQEAM